MGPLHWNRFGGRKWLIRREKEKKVLKKERREREKQDSGFRAGWIQMPSPALIFLFVLIATSEQTCKQSGLCVSSHMGLKCQRVSVSVLVFPEAS